MVGGQVYCSVMGMGCFETDAFLVGRRDDDLWSVRTSLQSILHLALCVYSTLFGCFSFLRFFLKRAARRREAQRCHCYGLQSAGIRRR